jgi:thiol-disulfide isomerase/thioredoxin
MDSIKNSIKIGVLFFVISSCFAQKKQSNQSGTLQGYEITINTQNISNETLQLSLQYGTAKKKLVTDSIVVKNSNQKVVFKQSKKIVGAIYRLGLKSNPNNYIELALDSGSTIQVVILSANTQTWTVTKNQLNIDFLAYQRVSKPEGLLLRNELINKYPKTALHLYLWAENKIDAPKPPDVKAQELAYAAFFDEVAPTEKRLAFLPNINKLLYKFVTTVPISNENYIKHVDKLISGLDCKMQNYVIFIKYLAANISFFERYNLEEAYNHLFEKYIKENRCKVFTDAEMNKFSNEYETNKKVPLNSLFPDVTFARKDSTAVTIQEIYSKNDFTLLTFFSPTCQHCIDKMPEISKFMANVKEKYPLKKTAWITVLNDTDETKWIEFLEKNQLERAAINLKSMDPTKAYQHQLNTYSNPSYFLLDQQGKVVLKSFNNKAILELINQ